jgi:hypothetical protein
LRALVALGFALGVLVPTLACAQGRSTKRDENTRSPEHSRPPIEFVAPPGDTAFRPRQWFTNRYLPDAVVVRVTGRRNRVACEDTTKPPDFIQFYSLTPGSRRDPNSRTIAPAWSDSLGCVVVFRWLLSDETGEQELVARLVHSPDNKPELGYALVNPPLRAIAHLPPALIVGLSLQSRTVQLGGSSDSSKLEPILGIDVPAYFPISRKYWLPNVRLMIGTSIKDIGSDLHIGLSWLPLLVGVRGEGFPIQGYSGYRFGFGGRKNSWIIFALTYNASSAISTFLRVITRGD